MKQLETLIKMHKLYVDEQRRVLGVKQAEADAIMMAIATLQANLEMEKERAAQTQEQEVLFSIGIYIKEQLKKHERMQLDLSAKEAEVAVERDKLSAMFEELKRYEIAQENWLEEQRLAEQKAENKVYDEQSGQRHHQRGEN
ncbi:MAG: hypothetical protein SFW65_07600 [Alphaproteobacteria bacterium]|nr:hypothetical protein [Alphaproteobacteria bacterium]